MAFSVFDYNTILKQSGQPHEEFNVETVHQSKELFVCHGYFGATNITSSEINTDYVVSEC